MIAEFGWLAVAALAVPAVLIAMVPRRWLGRTMLGWAVMPLLVYIGVIVWESATRPGTEISLENAMLGFSLISAIFVIPWALACAVGFALGFGLRAMFRRSAPAVPAPASAPAPVPAPTPADGLPTASLAAAAPPTAQSSAAMSAAPVSAIMSDGADWVPVHIGFSGDGLRIAGHDVWTEDWRRVDAAPLHLPHPAHTGELHRFTVQDIGDGAAAVRFAVGELSNGVYGFYVAREAPVSLSALSGDGTLRYELHYSANAEAEGLPPDGWAVLTDVATGHMLADCRAWPASRIEGKANGSLFLWLTQDDGETLIRIDPASRIFRNQGEGGAGQPLSGLSDYVAELRRTRAGQPAVPFYRRISPDGVVRIELEAVEWGNSHWVYAPRVIEIASGEVILDLWGTDWDATISYPGYARVALDFRRYHFSGDLGIELDLGARIYRILREPGGIEPLPSGPLTEARSAMEESGRRVAAFAAAQNAARPLWDSAPASPFAAWRTALIIIFVAAVLIVVATLLSIDKSSQPDPSPVLIREIPKPDL
jgi:hypothetical protein